MSNLSDTPIYIPRPGTDIRPPTKGGAESKFYSFFPFRCCHGYASLFSFLARIEPPSAIFARNESWDRNRTRLHRLMDRNDLLVEALL